MNTVERITHLGESITVEPRKDWFRVVFYGKETEYVLGTRPSFERATELAKNRARRFGWSV